MCHVGCLAALEYMGDLGTCLLAGMLGVTAKWHRGPLLDLRSPCIFEHSRVTTTEKN